MYKSCNIYAEIIAFHNLFTIFSASGCRKQTIFVTKLQNTKPGMKTLQRQFNKGCTQFGLFEDGDRILIALSGGKDSMVMTHLLGQRAQIFRPHIHVEAAHVVMDNIPYASDLEYLQDFCKNQGIKLHILHSSFDESTDRRHTHCYLCSRYRRQALLRFATDNGFNKVALGHHNDDILTTLLMNLTFEGSNRSMPPKLTLEHFPISIIRPLCLVHEEQLIAAADNLSIRKQKRQCPYETDTKRKTMREMLDLFQQINPEARYSLWHSLGY